MIDWKIQCRARQCQHCAQAFGDKQPYFTVLFERKQDLERLDVCPACWEAHYSKLIHSQKEFISFWQGIYNQAPPPAPEAIQKDSAESLLRKLIERNELKYQAACFILAVMLERKRMIKVKAQTKQDGRRTIVYEHPKTGDIFTVVDPDLRLTQLEVVQHDVAYLLEHGLPESEQEKNIQQSNLSLEDAPTETSVGTPAESSVESPSEPLPASPAAEVAAASGSSSSEIVPAEPATAEVPPTSDDSNKIKSEKSSISENTSQ